MTHYDTTASRRPTKPMTMARAYEELDKLVANTVYFSIGAEISRPGRCTPNLRYRIYIGRVDIKDPNQDGWQIAADSLEKVVAIASRHYSMEVAPLIADAAAAKAAELAEALSAPALTTAIDPDDLVEHAERFDID